MNVELIIFISAISIIVVFAGVLLLFDSRGKAVERKLDEEYKNLPDVEKITLGCNESVYECLGVLPVWINELTRPVKVSKQLPRNRRTHNIKSLTNKGQL